MRNINYLSIHLKLPSKLIGLLIILMMIVWGQSCTTSKGPYTYQICVHHEADTSVLIEHGRTSMTDTTVAVLSGYIYSLTPKETLSFASISLKAITTDSIYGQLIDSSGLFSLATPTGTYTLQVQSIGFSSIKRNLTLRAGETRTINIGLGQDDAFVTYTITSNRKLSRRQLKKKGEELKKKSH